MSLENKALSQLRTKIRQKARQYARQYLIFSDFQLDHFNKMQNVFTARERLSTTPSNF